MNLTIFDLDNTLLAGDSDYLWGQFLVDEGVVERTHYEHENQRFYEQYKAGTLDIHAFQRFSLSPLIEHPTSTMLALRKRFVSECIAPIVAPAAPSLIAAHRERGDALLIITATNSFVTTPIAELLGIDDLLATDPEFVDGNYTGAIAGIPCFQDGKITRLDNWLAEQTQRFEKVWGYSDSHNDLPLLERSDFPVAVDPDTKLQDVATERDWPIVSLRNGADGAQIFREVTSSKS